MTWQALEKEALEADAEMDAVLQNRSSTIARLTASSVEDSQVRQEKVASRLQVSVQLLDRKAASVENIVLQECLLMIANVCRKPMSAFFIFTCPPSPCQRNNPVHILVCISLNKLMGHDLMLKAHHDAR